MTERRNRDTPDRDGGNGRPDATWRPEREQAAVDEAARRWFLTLSDETATEADRACFATWYAADPRHRAAYQELTALWVEIDDLRDAFASQAKSPRAGKPTNRPPASSQPRPTAHRARARAARRPALTGGLAAACLALAIVAAPELTTRLGADHLTGVGEQARIVLPDGSVAWLNTDTAIAVDYDAVIRRIALLRGEAQFHVARDPARPFAVRAQRGRSTALGTVFAVHARDQRVTTVTVTEGRVEVVSPADTQGSRSLDSAARAVLAAGEQVVYREGAAPGPVRRAPSRALAWREGMIAIDGQPLAEALAEIDRYRRGRILLLADTAQLEPVTARLSLDALDRGLEALAATHDLTVTRVTEYLVLIR